MVLGIPGTSKFWWWLRCFNDFWCWWSMFFNDFPQNYVPILQVQQFSDGNSLWRFFPMRIPTDGAGWSSWGFLTSCYESSQRHDFWNKIVMFDHQKCEIWTGIPQYVCQCGNWNRRELVDTWELALRNMVDQWILIGWFSKLYLGWCSVTISCYHRYVSLYHEGLSLHFCSWCHVS